MFPKKIALIGAECSGKSTLASALAKQTNCLCVGEYARTFFETNDPNYSFDDVITIANKQHQLMLEGIDAATKRKDTYIFFDTSLVVVEVWMLVKYGKSIPSFMLQEKQMAIDTYLLCKPDVQWQADHLREHPNQRMELHNRYVSELLKNNIEYILIDNSNRDCAIDLI
jgi:NadR type nicotinamide-nucleotide adenylyltransferase